MRIQEIRNLARDEVLDAWNVGSFDEAYAQYPDREVARLIHSTEEFIDDFLADMSDYEVARLFQEPDVLGDAMGMGLDLFSHEAAVSLGTWLRIYLARNVIMDEM